MNKLDHIVIAADSLEQGIEYIRQQLGVDIPKGGFHATMGTHNHLMQLGNHAYLELIAINPEGEEPSHPRWFGLDDALMRESLRQQPRLITWVMNTTDLANVKAFAELDIGIPTALTRNNLSWEIALTGDGRLIGNGLLPYVIQWHSEPHPSNGMADLDCQLVSLELHHNRAGWLYDKLKSIGADGLVTVHALDDHEAPYLLANIETPDAVIALRS